MTDANLRRLLSDALPHTPPATLTDFDLQIHLQEADAGRITPHASVTALLECLHKDPALAIFRGRTQIMRDVGKSVTHVFLAEWLLGRAAVAEVVIGMRMRDEDSLEVLAAIGNAVRELPGVTDPKLGVD